MVWCSTGVVPEWCSCGGVFLGVWCSTGVVLEWCFCGGVFVVVWWCGGVFVVTGGVVVFLWWCLCDGVFVLVWWCFCGGVLRLCFCGGGGVFEVFLCFRDCVSVCFFCQGSTFVALPRSYAKSVDNTGVKRCLV